MGKYLAYKVSEEFELENCEIQHVQGIKIGKKLQNENEIMILVFMRAGIYIGEGFRFIFQKSPYFHISPKRHDGLSKVELNELKGIEGKSIIILDSVINTGSTMIPVIKQIQAENPKKIIVSSLVMPNTTAEVIEKAYSNVQFYIARISTNKYVGKGKKDTGNRLFGTL